MARIRADKPVRTRHGHKVRILTWTGGTDRYPIVGVVGVNPRATSWTAEGLYHDNQDDEDEHPLDLVQEPERVEVLYFNLRSDRPFALIPPSPSFHGAVVRVTRIDGRITNVEMVDAQLADDG